MTAISGQARGPGMGEAAELVFLAEIGQQPGISIRVVPASASSHIEAQTGGVLLFARDTRYMCAGHESSLAHVDNAWRDGGAESATGADCSPDVVRELNRVALSPSEFRALVREAADALRAGQLTRGWHL